MIKSLFLILACTFGKWLVNIMPSIKDKQSRSDYCPLMPQGAPPAVFLLFSSACFCVSLSTSREGRLWHWCSCTLEDVHLLVLAPSWPSPVFPAEKMTCTMSRAAVEPPLCLFSKHSAFSCANRVLSHCPRQKNAGKQTCLTLADCPAQSREVGRGSPWYRVERAGTGRCKVGTLCQVGGEGWAQALMWLVLAVSAGDSRKLQRLWASGFVSKSIRCFNFQVIIEIQIFYLLDEHLLDVESDVSEVFSPWWHCQYKHLNFLGTGRLIPNTFSPGLGLEWFWSMKCSMLWKDGYMRHGVCACVPHDCSAGRLLPGACSPSLLLLCYTMA